MADRADRVERRLRRERAARQEAEAVAEQVTRDLYEAVLQLTASQAVLDATTDYVSIADIEGRPQYLNRALSEFCGLEPGELGDVNVIALFTPQSRTRFVDEAVPALVEKGVWRGELAWVHADGRELAVSQVLVAHRRPDGLIERISSIARDVSEQRAMQEELAHLALHDPLTGLGNRRLFLDRLDVAEARLGIGHAAFAVLYLDLDGFKFINDTLGHEAGDEVLLVVSRRLAACCRGIDMLARLGGDEFAVLCEELKGDDDAIEIAERLAAALDEPFVVAGVEVAVGLSIGIAVSTEPVGPDEILRRADAAMYEAKATGAGRWQLFDRAR